MEFKAFVYDNNNEGTGFVCEPELIDFSSKSIKYNDKYYKNYELMQFTGLYDKKFNKIYNGDIVELTRNGKKCYREITQRTDGLWVATPTWCPGHFWNLNPAENGYTSTIVIGNKWSCPKRTVYVISHVPIRNGEQLYFDTHVDAMDFMYKNDFKHYLYKGPMTIFTTK